MKKRKMVRAKKASTKAPKPAKMKKPAKPKMAKDKPTSSSFSERITLGKY